MADPAAVRSVKWRALSVATSSINLPARSGSVRSGLLGPVWSGLLGPVWSDPIGASQGARRLRPVARASHPPPVRHRRRPRVRPSNAATMYRYICYPIEPIPERKGRRSGVLRFSRRERTDGRGPPQCPRSAGFGSRHTARSTRGSGLTIVGGEAQKRMKATSYPASKY